MKFRSLYSRIALTFAALVLLFGGLCGGLDLVAAKNHQQEIIQRLSRGLAEHIASHWPLLNGEGFDGKAVSELFHMLMIVNPSIELYLLDAKGAILAYDAPPGRVRLKEVSLAPLRGLLEGGALPVKGDNPRRPDRREIFSATPLKRDGRIIGYLYIVLAGDEYQRLAEDVWQGHVFQSVMWTGAGALLLTLVAGLGLFSLVTRRLDALTRTIAAFDDASFSGTLQLDGALQSSPDEIGRLAATFSRMAERIAAQVQHIKSQDTLRREMVANVSHDLRTPLTSMQGYLETMLRKSDRLSPAERQQYLEVAVRQSRRVAHLAQELFELAKLECEEVRPSFERFSLQELVQDVAQKFELAADAKGVRIAARFRDRIPLVYADIAMIERVLTNLIDNALRHTPEGGEIDLTLRCEAGDRVTVRVEDSGAGIASELLPSLFERDSPLRRDSGRHMGGGLGLLISKRMLELHGSTIEALSGEGRGAVFTFSLAAPA
ncbi:sensor histidine kinase [Methylococcus mesophilus]|uniref:sensor histidine kinase n=1 Tax=Methylococcus mesophilus TaxID=2993564 RepID=UPI00224B75A7|nr:ATP-binding protein [Methylococcus mesophilus]UZR30054.1 ATP-binding protein [Methylococcus mesophilus]